MGLHPGDIDRFVFNAGEDISIAKQKEIRVSLRPGVYESHLKWQDMTVWRRLQEMYLGQWSGCDNPGIDHVPDGHPCMPGVPDDEVNLLL